MAATQIRPQAGTGSAVTAGSRLGAYGFQGAQDAAHTITTGSLWEAFASEAYTGTTGGTYVVLATNHTGTVTLTNDFQFKDGNCSILNMATAGVLTNSASGQVSSVSSLPTSLGGTGGADANGNYASACTPVSGITTVTNTSSPYTILSTDRLLLVDTSSGAVTLNMPNPALNRLIEIKDKKGTFGTNNVTLARYSTESIEGLAANLVLRANWGNYEFRSDGSNYYKTSASSNRATMTWNATTSFTIPAGVTNLDLTGRGGSGAGGGGGGGGGGSTSAGAAGGAGGGQGGSVVSSRNIVSVVPGTSYTVTVGAGGTAGTSGAGAAANAAGAAGSVGGNGGTGGTTSFGTLASWYGGTGGTASYNGNGNLSTAGSGSASYGGIGNYIVTGSSGSGGTANVAGSAGGAVYLTTPNGNTLTAGGAGGAAGGTNGGGGGGGTGVSVPADGSSQTPTAGGAGGASGAAGGAAPAVNASANGVGGTGGGGGGGGGTLASTGSAGGAGAAGGAGSPGYVTGAWME